MSLAAALVHSPPLLILDEPTVGVDPLLRQSIWRHLVAMTKTEKISVIITTHYIEEARLANVIGLMRNGRILAEDSPDNLMHTNQTTNLEDVFLKLCITDSSRRAAQLATMSNGHKQAMMLDQLNSAKSIRLTTSAAARKSNHQGNRLKQRHHRSSQNSSPRRTIVSVINTETINPSQSTGEQTNLVIKNDALDPNKATVRIDTATNRIELLNGQVGHVNEAVENFSSEEEEEDDEGDYNDDDDFEHRDQVDPYKQPLGGIVAGAKQQDGSLSSLPNDESLVENYLAVQHLQWSTRRANMANLLRINARRYDKGPYRGLDGRRARINSDAYSNSGYGLEASPCNFVQWWRTLMAVTWKNYIRLRRNPPVLVFQFMLPAIQVILFCLCIGGEPFDVPVAIVNDEIVPKSSAQFLNGLNKKIIRQVKYDNLTSAIEAVKRGKVWGALHIPDKFSEHLQSRLIMGEEVTNETISNGTIKVYPDLTSE